jgi:hypothetical protein
MTGEGWSRRRLTGGTAEGRYHQHSYYDINIFDDDSRRIAAYALGFMNRDVTPEDVVRVGYVDTGESDAFVPVGESRAFSLQQGPMAQWIPSSRTMIWNDREGGAHVARLHDRETGETRTLPCPVYAVSPNGRTGLSLDMARLDGLRPGYGYPGAEGGRLDERCPEADGVWKIDLETGERRLILSLATARDFVLPRLGVWRGPHLVNRYHYWFNHAKFSPDGRRFTVKFRWKVRGKQWRDRMSVSLTADPEGGTLSFVARGASHVLWEDPQTLFFYRAGPLCWSRGRPRTSPGWVRRVRDAPERSEALGSIGRNYIRSNAHLRKIPGQEGLFVYDTPYRSRIDLALYDEGTDESRTLETFSGHDPAQGPHRCDLHAVPSPDGRHVVVTSLADGGRQLYLLSRP